MYDNPYWEYHLPVNPPGAYFKKGHDVMMSEIDISNWECEGGYEFQPRIPIQKVRDDKPPRAALDDEAPEVDIEYDCD